MKKANYDILVGVHMKKVTFSGNCNSESLLQNPIKLIPQESLWFIDSENGHNFNLMEL